MIKLIKLLKLANRLDKLGLFEEANLMDVILKMAASQSGLIRALKSNDAKEARKALDTFIASVPSYSTPEKELGMTGDEYREFVNAIKSGLIEIAKHVIGIGKPLPNQSQRVGPNARLMAELNQLKSIIEPHQGAAAKGHYSTSLDTVQDYIVVDAGLAFNPNDLVKELEQAGYKKYIPDGREASRTKKFGKERIVVTVDISGSAIPTEISMSPITKEYYDAIASVFRGVLGPNATGKALIDLDFDEAVKQSNDPGPPHPFQGP